MKKTVLAALLLALSGAANADFFGGNDGEWKMGPNGPYWDESDWPVWTPMYWMEEMMDSFDSDDNFGSYGNMMSPGSYYPQQMTQQMPQMPYGGNYGYQQQQPMAAPQMTAPSMPAAPQMTAPQASVAQ